MNLSLWYVCFVSLKIIGLAPMSWLQHSTIRNPFKISAQGKAYSIVILILWILTHVYFLSSLFKTEDSGFFSISYGLFLLEKMFIIFTTILTLSLSQNSIVDICNELHETNYSLEAFDIDYRGKKIDNKLKFLISVNGLFSVTYPTLRALFYCTNVIQWFFIIDSILIIWIMVQYVGMIILMGAMIETINDQFQRFCDDPGIVVEDLINESISHINYDVMSGQAARVDILQKLYLKLTKTAIKYADFYGFIMLICIVETFYNILIEAFLIINMISMGERSVPKCLPKFGILLCFFWSTLVLFSVTFSVTKLTSEVTCSFDRIF